MERELAKSGIPKIIMYFFRIHVSKAKDNKPDCVVWSIMRSTHWLELKMVPIERCSRVLQPTNIAAGSVILLSGGFIVRLVGYMKAGDSRLHYVGLAVEKCLAQKTTIDRGPDEINPFSPGSRIRDDPMKYLSP